MEKNISQEKRIEELEARLKEQEKLGSLGLLSAGIAHEIQNPLNFVINFSKLSGQLLADLADRVDEAKARIPEAELEERVRELEKLKVHPRDLSENQQMMERLEALYQEVYPEQKEQVQQMIRTFEEFLDGQNPRQIQGYRRYLEKAVSVLEYYDPFEEEFDASESDWDLWDEEEAQDPDNEETDEEEFWKKEGDDHSWTS